MEPADDRSTDTRARRDVPRGRITAAWLSLTPREQTAIVLVAALFLLGVAVRCWLATWR